MVANVSRNLYCDSKEGFFLNVSFEAMHEKGTNLTSYHILIFPDGIEFYFNTTNFVINSKPTVKDIHYNYLLQVG